MLEVHPSTIQRHEHRLGLDAARCREQIWRETVYNLRIVERALRERGLWP